MMQVKEVALPESCPAPAAATFLACLAAVLELPASQLPRPADREDPATGWTVSRWLGGLGLGIARVADPAGFSWPGPWIARVRTPSDGDSRYVVMYGVPSGVAWDPTGDSQAEQTRIEDGFLVAAADIALALPPRPKALTAAGVLERIWIAAAAGVPARSCQAARATAGQGLDGDRHVAGTGTFPSGLPGSALTLISAEVCESFSPPLRPDEHRRNLVTRGIDLNGLVGRDFVIGGVRCRGMRLCEPCVVIQRRASRPLLRQLVHRGGLRADILTDGVIKAGDQIATVEPARDRPCADFTKGTD
jgi:MOSC domain